MSQCRCGSHDVAKGQVLCAPCQKMTGHDNPPLFRMKPCAWSDYVYLNIPGSGGVTISAERVAKLIISDKLNPRAISD